MRSEPATVPVMPPGDVGLELTGVRKHFGGVAALRGVDFTSYGGEVHALLGQNGSGKSTLVKVMTGIHHADPGVRMRLWGEEVSLPLAAAHEAGIAVIHQDLGLVESMTVTENMGVASGYGRRALAPFSMASERRRTRALLDELGLDVSPDTLVADLPPASRATVAIARAMRVLREHRERFVFVLDEPTAYLSAEESAQVVRLMRSVADAGSAVIFISHRLQEVAAVADRVTVLRDGQVVDTLTREQIDTRRIIEGMLGQRLERAYPEPPPLPGGEPSLVVSDLSGDRVEGLSLSARAGEIVGIAGLVGMGQDEVPHLLSGAAPARTGSVLLRGRELVGLDVAQRIREGVSLVPGNRQRDGLWLQALASENLAILPDTTRSMLSRRRRGDEDSRAGRLMQQFGVRPPDPGLLARQFSGGNQQKVVLAKWMSHEVALLLMDEPTQGIDAGAKYDVLKVVCDAAAGGAVVVIASGDYEQLAQVCHRVLIMRFGVVVDELTGARLTETEIAAATQT